MKKLRLFIFVCFTVLSLCCCNKSNKHDDPDNFETSGMKAIKGHIYIWERNSEGYGHWKHDSTCVKCMELKHKAYIEDCNDSCITVKIYNIK